MEYVCLFEASTSSHAALAMRSLRSASRNRATSEVEPSIWRTWLTFIFLNRQIEFGQIFSKSRERRDLITPWLSWFVCSLVMPWDASTGIAAGQRCWTAFIGSPDHDFRAGEAAGCLWVSLVGGPPWGWMQNKTKFAKVLGNLAVRA